MQAERNTKRNKVYFCIPEAQLIFGKAKVMQAERNTKRNKVYFCIPETQLIFGEAKVMQAGRNTKETKFIFAFPRRSLSSAKPKYAFLLFFGCRRLFGEMLFLQSTVAIDEMDTARQYLPTIYEEGGEEIHTRL
jgi:hypothetical protein